MSKDSNAIAADRALIPPHAWVRIGVLGVLFVWVFWRLLQRAYGPLYSADGSIRGWGYGWSESEWTHVLVIPLMSLYFAYLQADKLKKTPIKPSFMGFGVLAFGLLTYWAGIFPIRNLVFMGLGMIISLAGLVWLFTGWRVMWLMSFPIFFLVFIIRIPDRVMERIAYPLQDIAAKSAGFVINIIGPLFFELESEIRGNTIYLMHHGEWLPNPLNVAEACSGLRSLMMFVTLGFGVAFISSRPLWARLVIVASTVPVAVLVNIGRVSVMGFLQPYKSEMTEGDFHKFIGILMLLPAGLIFLFIGWVLSRIFVEVPQSGKPAKGAKA